MDIMFKDSCRCLVERTEAGKQCIWLAVAGKDGVCLALTPSDFLNGTQDGNVVSPDIQSGPLDLCFFFPPFLHLLPPSPSLFYLFFSFDTGSHI